MSDIRICPKCGTWVNRDEEYCSNCGKRLPFDQSTKEEKGRRAKSATSKKGLS